MNQGQGNYQGMPPPTSSEGYQSQGSSSNQNTPQQRPGEPPKLWPGQGQQRLPEIDVLQQTQSGMLPKSGPHQPVMMLPVMYQQLPQPGVQQQSGVPQGWPQYAVPQHPQQQQQQQHPQIQHPQYPPHTQFVYPSPVQYSYQPHYSEFNGQFPGQSQQQQQQQQQHPGQQPQQQQQQQDRVTATSRPYSTAFGLDSATTQLPSLAAATSSHHNATGQPQIQHHDSTDSQDSLRSQASALLAARVPVPPYAIATTNSLMNKKNKPGSPTSDTNPNKKGFRNSRRRHRNSHLGCATCKSRRIKCDEQLPECRNCIRARLTCAYLALDDAARDALKVAQQAHAARIQSLNIQATQREQQKQIPQQPQHQYPYEIHGLPTRIFMNQLPPFPPPESQQIEINLQRADLPPQQPRLEAAMSQAINPGGPPLPHMIHMPSHTSMPQPHFIEQHHHNHIPPTASAITPVSTAMTNNGSSSTGETAQSSASSDVSPDFEPRFAIKSDGYASLAALLKEHKDIDPQRDLDQLSRLDSEFTEIVLDPGCMMQLNRFWPGFDKSLLLPFEGGFEQEDLYAEYDAYHRDHMMEAQNNIVLFKSLLASGAAFVGQRTKDVHAKDIAKRHLNRDFEITLRYLNKFRISFTDEIKDIKRFYLNVSMVFSTFQTYQSAFLTTFYGEHSLSDNYEFVNRFFDFLSQYLNNEFTVFLRDDLPSEITETKLFQRAELLNSYMHVFIIYYVQCIKALHTKPYKTVFMGEFLIKLKAIKSYVYNKVSAEDKLHYDNLVEFISESVQYWYEVREEGVDTNRIQVIFYSLKKFLSIIPENSILGSGKFSFEQELIYAYYHAAIGALKAIYSETRFFFLFSFNGRDGTRTANHLVKMYDENQVTDAQRNLLKYPVTVIKYFKERSFTFSQFLKNVSQFPAKIMLDDTNKQILANLVQEEQLESFNSDIKEENYPHIEETSNFYDKSTNSIVIPSVSTTRTFSNFGQAQLKRSQMLKKSVDGPLSDTDKRLITAFFGEDKADLADKSE